MRTGTQLVFAALVIAGVAHAQPRALSEGQTAPFIFYETINLPASDSGQSRVDLLYRIDREFFIAVRNSDTTFPYGFIRRGEISVELIDSTGVSRARDIERISIGEQSQERDPAIKSWYQGIFSLNVAPGIYNIALEVTDLESKRDFTNRERIVRAAHFGSKPIELSTPLFLSGPPPPAFPDTLLAQNFGNDFLWGSQGCLFFTLSGSALADSTLAIHSTLSLVPPSTDAPVVVAEEDLRGVVPIRGLEILPVKVGDDVGYRFTAHPGTAAACVFLDFHSDTLLLRDYSLEIKVTQGALEQKASRRFRMVWPDMPVSLRNVDYALDALRYITPEDHLDSLKSGDYETRRANLEAFWKSIDKSTGGVRNSAMIQYYRRVDYAAKHFGTLRQPDGSKSDRGRVFILYGPPTKTERTLDPTSGFTEAWSYERLNKKFTFRDQTKTGDYSLIATTSL